MTKARYAHAIYERLKEFWAGDKFKLGKFKGSFKLMTNVNHYNIAPTRFEKQLKLDEVEFLYVMMN